MNMITADEVETAEETARSEVVEGWIRQLKWSPNTDKYTKTLVDGNIRGFFYWLLRKNHLRPIPASEEVERAKFEKWTRDQMHTKYLHNLSLRREHEGEIAGEYISAFTQGLWLCWRDARK